MEPEYNFPEPLLDEGPRQFLRDNLDRERGRAWAFVQAVGQVWYYVNSNPTMRRAGRRTLDRILANSVGATAPR